MTTGGRRFGLRLLSSTFVFFVSAVILLIVTDTLARLGVKPFLHELSKAAEDAVQAVQPQRLLARFYEIQDWHRCHDEPWGSRPSLQSFLCTREEKQACASESKRSEGVKNTLGAKSCPDRCRANTCSAEEWSLCRKVYNDELFAPSSFCPGDAWQRCFGNAASCTYAETYRAHQYFFSRWPGAVYDLGWEIWGHGTTAEAVFGLIQLAAGCAMAFALCTFLIDRMEITHGGIQLYLVYFAVPVVGVIATVVLSWPLSIVMYLGSEVLGHIVPEHSEFQFWGATLSTIFFASSARTAEAGLHHGLDRLIEHVITKIGRS